MDFPKQLHFDGFRTRLVQRLNKPQGRIDARGQLISNPFSFGGGAPLGGFTEQTMTTLLQVFEFAYMGAGEFEYGRVAESFKIFLTHELVTFIVSLGGHTFTRDDTTFTFVRNETRGSAIKVPVYVIAPKQLKLMGKTLDSKEYATMMLRKSVRPRSYPNFKRPAYIREALFMQPLQGEYERIVGWFEIDNNFFFFKDKPTYEKFCGMLGVIHV